MRKYRSLTRAIRRNKLFPAMIGEYIYLVYYSRNKHAKIGQTIYCRYPGLDKLNTKENIEKAMETFKQKEK